MFNKAVELPDSSPDILRTETSERLEEVPTLKKSMTGHYKRPLNKHLNVDGMQFNQNVNIKFVKSKINNDFVMKFELDSEEEMKKVAPNGKKSSRQEDDSSN
jgi:hypothetical protein